MHNKFISLIIFYFLCCTLYIIVNANANGLKKEQNTALNSAVHKLAKVGGIGSLDSPRNSGRFYASIDRNLTSEQKNQLLKEAITELKRLIETDTLNIEAYHFLGVAYILSNQDDRAISALRVAITDSSPRESSFIYLCSLLWKMQNFDESQKVVDNFLASFPNKKLAGLTLLGSNYFHSKNYVMAIKTGVKIISVDPSNIAAHLLVANSYFLLDRKDEAEKAYKKVIALDPQLKPKINEIKNKLNNNRKSKQ